MYKAKINFSFAGKNYVEGQEVDIQDEEILKKLEARKQITSGKGKTAPEVAADVRSESVKKSEAADKQRKAEADARQKEFEDLKGKPKPSVRLNVDDQTQGVKEKDDKSGPNPPVKK